VLQDEIKQDERRKVSRSKMSVLSALLFTTLLLEFNNCVDNTIKLILSESHDHFEQMIT